MIELCVVTHTCNFTWKREARGSRVKGHPQLLSEFKAIFTFVRACLNFFLFFFLFSFLNARDQGDDLT